MPTTPPNLRTPMYFRIQQSILEQIQRGLLKPGQQVPTETELAQQYQVSRITAKRALDELVRQGRAFRQQGRGTYVAQTRIRDTSGFGSFSADMRARGHIPGARVLTFTQVEPDAEVLERLKLAPGDEIYLLKRLRLVDAEPVAVETADPLELGGMNSRLPQKIREEKGWAYDVGSAFAPGNSRTVLKPQWGQLMLSPAFWSSNSRWPAQLVQMHFTSISGSRLSEFLIKAQLLGLCQFKNPGGS